MYLLVDTDKRDIEAVAARLGELKGGPQICFELVGRILRGYGPIIAAFEAEWTFYTTYFALTAEVLTDHNPETFCQHFGRTGDASKAAVRHARKYLKWLNAELAANKGTPHPYLERLATAATEKVTGLTVASSELRSQYRSQCK